MENLTKRRITSIQSLTNLFLPLLTLNIILLQTENRLHDFQSLIIRFLNFSKKPREPYFQVDIFINSVLNCYPKRIYYTLLHLYKNMQNKIKPMILHIWDYIHNPYSQWTMAHRANTPKMVNSKLTYTKSMKLFLKNICMQDPNVRYFNLRPKEIEIWSAGFYFSLSTKQSLAFQVALYSTNIY